VLVARRSARIGQRAARRFAQTGFFLKQVLRPVAPVEVVRLHPLLRDDRRAERELAAQTVAATISANLRTLPAP
jgi:hypothetical protein